MSSDSSVSVLVELEYSMQVVLVPRSRPTSSVLVISLGSVPRASELSSSATAEFDWDVVFVVIWSLLSYE